jgi:hypothetical protein
MMMALRRTENLNGEVLAILKPMECDQLDLLRVKNYFAKFYFNREICVYFGYYFQRSRLIAKVFLQVLVMFEINFGCKPLSAGGNE